MAGELEMVSPWKDNWLRGTTCFKPYGSPFPGTNLTQVSDLIQHNMTENVNLVNANIQPIDVDMVLSLPALPPIAVPDRHQKMESLLLGMPV